MFYRVNSGNTTEENHGFGGSVNGREKDTGKHDTRRAAKGDQIVLLEPITLTADLNIPCEVTFLLPPGVTLNTQGHALRAEGSENGAAAFKSIPKYLWKMAKKQ